MGKLRVMDRSGDSTLTWDPAVKEDVETIKVKFDEMIRRGFMAYSVDTAATGAKRAGGEIIRKFNPAAEEILMAAPLLGG